MNTAQTAYMHRLPVPVGLLNNKVQFLSIAVSVFFWRMKKISILF